jgi:myo-inositol-1(or 4)-monophosphatase
MTASASSLSAESLAELSEMALAVAEEAAALVAAGHRSRPHADKKGRSDLVTEFDRASEDLLMRRLSKLTPGIPIVGEERTAETHEPDVARPGLVWYVDPLDGTTNFVHGHPFWCVAVGLMAEDQPVAGAVIAPILGVRWRGFCVPGAGAPDRASGAGAPDRASGAGAAGGAWRNGERCIVSATPNLSEALIATGFPPVRTVLPASNFSSFISVKLAAQAVRRCGSAAMDICMVADGTYDGYWERRLHAWDTVAASAIVLAAGGHITSLSGGDPDYHVGHIIVSNGLIHDELLRTIEG